MTYREFLEWQAFYTMEPWGEWLNDLRFAQIAFLLANIWRGEKQVDPFPLQDFVFDWASMIQEARDQAKEESEAGDSSGWEDEFIAVLERRLAQQGEGD